MCGRGLSAAAGTDSTNFDSTSNQETNPESKSYFNNRWVSWWGGVVVIVVSGGVVFVFVVVDAVKRNAVPARGRPPSYAQRFN